MESLIDERTPSGWLKDLRRRALAADRFMPVIVAELRELVSNCGVADRRLRALAAQEDLEEELNVKRATVLELIRSCRWAKAVEMRGRRA